jgi:hypothetical protein
MTTSSQRLVGIAIGVVLGIAGTLLVMRLRTTDEPSTASTASSSGSGSNASATTLPTGSATSEVTALRARVAQLEASLRTGSASAARPDDEYLLPKVDTERGMSTSSEWWESLPRVPAWDQPRQQLVIERLAKLGVRLDAKNVECRKRCCRLTLSDEVYDEHLDEITSSVGLGISPPDGRGTSGNGEGEYFVIQCWSQEVPAAPSPDRALERDALLAKVKPEIQKCGQGVSPAITLKLWLDIDEDGQITKVQSNKAQLGSRAAACAETAILAAAAFAPSPMWTNVPITVAIGSNG